MSPLFHCWHECGSHAALTCQACPTSTPLAYSNLTPPWGWFFTHFQDIACGCQGISPCSCSSWDVEGVMNETMFQDVSSGTINPGWSVICHQPGIAPLQRSDIMWHTPRRKGSSFEPSFFRAFAVKFKGELNHRHKCLTFQDNIHLTPNITKNPNSLHGSRLGSWPRELHQRK